MNYKEISREPFIKEFTLAIIRAIEFQKFPQPEKTHIDTDLVPKISEKVIRASMGQKILPPKPKSLQIIQKPGKQIKNKKIFQPQRNIRRIPIANTHQRAQLQSLAPRPPTPISPKNIDGSILQDKEFSKIAPLLRDPSVFSVECSGPNRPLTVMRTGQKQITKIILTKEEIKLILKKASLESHIPLFEGVFKVAIENILINAVVSEMLGSKFIIKKQIPGIPQKQ